MTDHAPLTHIVLFTLTDGDDAPEAAARLNAMAGRIDGLDHVEAGVDESGSGWHVALTTRFRDREAMAAYGSDPVHVEVVEWLRPRIADRAVVDYAAPA